MSLHSPTGRHAHPSPQDAAPDTHDDSTAHAVRAAGRHVAPSAANSADGGATPERQRTSRRGRAPSARHGPQSSRSGARDQSAGQPHRRPGRPTSQEQIGLQDTRVSILQQARKLFMQRGFADVSVGEVANLVGVTKPTLYYHFQSKQGLYTAVLCDMMREVGGYIDEVVTRDAPVRERLRLLAVGYLAHARMRIEPMLRDTFELIGQEGANEVIHAYHEYLIAPIANLLRAGVASGEIAPHDPNLLTRAFLGLLDTFNDRDHEGKLNHAVSEPGSPYYPPEDASAAPTTPMRALQAPRPEIARLADLLVTLFLDGAAARPGA